MKISSAVIFIVATIAIPAYADEATGKQIFDEWCAGCHRDSPFAPATVLLKARGLEERAVIEQRTDLAPDLVRHVVRNGIAGMPSFRRVEISDAELGRLAGYLAKPGNR